MVRRDLPDTALSRPIEHALSGSVGRWSAQSRTCPKFGTSRARKPVAGAPHESCLLVSLGGDVALAPSRPLLLLVAGARPRLGKVRARALYMDRGAAGHKTTTTGSDRHRMHFRSALYGRAR